MADTAVLESQRLQIVEEAFTSPAQSALEPTASTHMLHLCLILLSFLSFYFIYYLTLLCNPMLATYKRLHKREQMVWTLNFVGAVHAVLSTAGSGLSLIFSNFVPPANLNSSPGEVLLFGSSPLAQATECLTVGYFIYDLSIILYQWRLVGGKAEVFFLIHHATAIAGLCFVLFFQMGDYFAACFIFFEVSTPFLHAIYFLKHYKQDDRKIFMVTGILFYLAFFFGRVVMSLYVNYQIFVTSARDVIHSTAGASGTPGFVYFICFGVPLVFLSLNTYWFILLNLTCFSELKDKNEGKAKEPEVFEKQKISSLKR